MHHVGDQMAASDIDTLSVDSVPGSPLFVRFSTVNFQAGVFTSESFFPLQFPTPYPSAFEHLVMIRLPRICSHSSRLDIREASSRFLCCVCRITSSTLPSC